MFYTIMVEGVKVMPKHKKSKEERERNREIVGKYHQKLTEDKLEVLYGNFQKWKCGEIPYFDLTEEIHQFHQANQKIWTLFNSDGWDDEMLIRLAKEGLGLVDEDFSD